MGGRRTDYIRRMLGSSTIVETGNGTTYVTRNYEVVCPVDTAHAFEISIAADDEAEALVGFRPLGVNSQRRGLNGLTRLDPDAGNAEAQEAAIWRS